ALLLGAPREATLQAALTVDVLQCIGVSLLSLEWLALRLPDRPLLRVELAFSVMVAAFVLAPITPLVAADGALRPLTNYFTTQGGSLFPLIPWSGYVFAGFLLGSLGGDRARRLGIASVGCASIGLIALSMERARPRALSPGYCFVKLACVLLLAAVLAWTVRSVPPLLARLSRETLFLYLSHVVILYADQVGLEPRLRDRHAPWFGIALAVLLMGVCGAGALAWRGLRAGGTKAPES
ncbi:MAG TPA: heparan-alpha-glucosaminide N-acetyltransferase domain-containing protein, partial [Polyangiales bacterium]|nr:heparan-alpha-glucosaminide N-acetyltransferase domain-containing protein [Polyangiales bacterium]